MNIFLVVDDLPLSYSAAPVSKSVSFLPNITSRFTLLYLHNNNYTYTLLLVTLAQYFVYSLINERYWLIQIGQCGQAGH